MMMITTIPVNVSFVSVTVYTWGAGIWPPAGPKLWFAAETAVPITWQVLLNLQVRVISHTRI
jgi:hypothetical protein